MILLRPCQSTQSQSEPSFFLTNRTGALHGGLRLANKAAIEVLFEEFAECNGFGLRHIVNRTKRWLSAFFKMDVMIVLGIMVRELVGFSLTEDVEVIMVFRRNL